MTVLAPASARYSPSELASALGLFEPTAEQAAVIAAPPGPLVVIAGAGAGKTETMAARVVWLVANGYAEPGQVLGLTFTRKAAGQLLRRVRSRLARLAGTGLVVDSQPALPVDEPGGAPVVGTYHAFAGQLLREYGLLSTGVGQHAPIEPDTRLLGETELWQLAFDVVNAYSGELRTEKNPAAVTAMVLRLSGQLAEHLVDTDELRDTHVELERLVHTLPAGPYQRDRGPSPAYFYSATAIRAARSWFSSSARLLPLEFTSQPCARLSGRRASCATRSLPLFRAATAVATARRSVSWGRRSQVPRTRWNSRSTIGASRAALVTAIPVAATSRSE